MFFNISELKFNYSNTATLIDYGYQIVDTMYTPAFADLPPESWKARLIKLP
jgi:pyruvate formate-lyase activating enzyme-like uncharacterized protein